MIQSIHKPDNWDCIVEPWETEREWLEARKIGIGASEVAAIFGVGYASQSPVTVWASKTGRAETEITPELQRLFNRGHRLEPVIAAEFQDETGLISVDPGRYTIYRHPSIAWLFATLDRYTVHPEFGPIPVELKAVNGRFRGDWNVDEEPPLKYMVQCQTQMAVTGASHCYLVGLIGGDELVVRLVERNQKFIDAMTGKLNEFWGYVERDEMPPVDESEATKAMLGMIYPKDTGLEVDLPAEFIELDRELLDLKEQAKTIKAKIDGIENKIKAAIGENTRGCLPSGSYTWKTQTRAEHIVRESTFRVLRRSNK